MPVDPEEGLITDLMFGVMIAFGADITLLVGVLSATGTVSTLSFMAVTGFIVTFFVGWIAWCWKEIRRITADNPGRTPLNEVKHQYATDEISDAELERKLDQLIDANEKVDTDNIELKCDR